MAKDEDISNFDTTPSLIHGHVPNEGDIKYTIGPYHVIGEIGRGGMGEVLLAYDTTCGRRIALKKIRADLLEHKNLQNRFLKEARITSQLAHPAIMPIYVIHDKDDITYYTMPYVRGETLKKILRTTREQEKKGEPLDHIGGSIPALIRIFLTVCQAIAYAHLHNALHRDIKPENIMIGRYGEVLILDWGLAKLIDQEEDNEETTPSAQTSELHELTRVGKVVGTLSYMSPERAEGGPATILSDIYALGVTLFQMLALRNPFHRENLETFRKNMHQETVPDPIELSPYRDIPRVLSRICLKCLEPNPNNRYQTVDELLRDIENYIEGRSEWFHITKLDIYKRGDWEFQENILLTEHIAITRGTEYADWVSLMISKDSFGDKTKIEANVTIGNKGDGLGFLLSVPETAERRQLNDGYCLWLGSDFNKTTKLLRSNVEVVHAPEIFLERHRSYHIRIEKIDQNIYFYLNNILQFSYISHLPLAGTHIGILSRDGDFILEDFNVFVGSQNIMVNCLAVPDAFLAHKDYNTALNEYRRIGYSFPGRAEGREAMFRAGLTILEQAKATRRGKKQKALFNDAMDEFEKLHDTPGAPLEYLGKAHVYQAMQDPDEEIKCYELAFRRYPKHPLLPIIHEQLIYRMHEVSRTHRRAAYQFILTALKHLPEATTSIHTKRLFDSLQRNWEQLDFIQKDPSCTKYESLRHKFFGIQLAFWADSPLALIEFIKDLSSGEDPNVVILSNGFYSLINLGYWSLAREKLNELPEPIKSNRELALVSIAITSHEKSPDAALKKFRELKNPILSWSDTRLLLHLAQAAIDNNNPAFIHSLPTTNLPPTLQKMFDGYKIWASLLEKNWITAGQIFDNYTYDDLIDEESPLYILYGCWLIATETKELAEAHFSGALDTTYPHTTTLLSHYLKRRLPKKGVWYQRAFSWEKQQLARQLKLYKICSTS